MIKCINSLLMHFNKLITVETIFLLQLKQIIMVHFMSLLGVQSISTKENDCCSCIGYFANTGNSAAFQPAFSFIYFRHVLQKNLVYCTLFLQCQETNQFVFVEHFDLAVIMWEKAWCFTTYLYSMRSMPAAQPAFCIQSIKSGSFRSRIFWYQII